MKFIAFYINKGNIEKEVIDSCAFTLANIKGKINAYKTGRELSKIKYDDLYLNLEKDFENEDIKSIYEDIVRYSNDNKLLGENIEEILDANDITYRTNDTGIFTVDIIIKNSYASLKFKYNVYGILSLIYIQLYKDGNVTPIMKAF